MRSYVLDGVVIHICNYCGEDFHATNERGWDGSKSYKEGSGRLFCCDDHRDWFKDDEKELYRIKWNCLRTLMRLNRGLPRDEYPQRRQYHIND